MAQSLSDPPVAGQIITVLGIDLNHQGLGLARWQGWVVIVPQLLPGEEAQVQLLQRKKSQWFARHLKTIVAASGARRPPCILKVIVSSILPASGGTQDPRTNHWLNSRSDRRA